jgi:diguanylate cyclase (GGDEF)-like protein
MCRHSRFGLFVLVLAWGMAHGVAHAACLASADPVAARIDAIAARDPREAIRQAAAALAAGGSSDALRRASLLAVQAQSYSALELDGDARRAASTGLELARDPRSAAHVALSIALAENIYDAAGIDGAVASIEAERAAQPPGTPADICLLVALGGLQHRQNRTAESVASLTAAYRASAAPALIRQRVAAAAILAAVMRSAGDFQQALALNQEVIDWDSARGASIELSVNQYMRGSIYMGLRNYENAIGEFAKSRTLSERLGDSQGIAFADMSTCQAHIETGAMRLARQECDSAARVFNASRSTDVLKQCDALLARIDLAEGRLHSSLARLNEALDHGGTDMPQRQVAPIYKARAQTFAALGDYRAAFVDLDEYLNRYTAENELDRTLQAAAQRARFETDREIERNGALQRELALSTEMAAHRAGQLRFTVSVIVIGSIGTALLAYALYGNLRYRNRLIALAEQDDLTGLPNRRRIAALANQALTAAAASGRPVTIGLIDLDHFKSINDRCGHAIGDRVLKEFAALGRGLLRSQDAFGRWGGEEYLVVFHDTPLDAAVEVTDRLRAAALLIELPASAGDFHVSFSAGLAARTDNLQSLDAIVASADAALYEAKHQGRNLVRIDQDSYHAAATGVRQALRGRM